MITFYVKQGGSTSTFRYAITALAILAAPTAALAQVSLVSHRITQGLEEQRTGTVSSYYDLVAGKKTLVQATVFSPTDRLVRATCEVTFNSTVRSYPAAPLLVVVPTGGNYTFSCWLPGSTLEEPGIYNFRLLAYGSSGTPHSIAVPFGRYFQRTKDLRLMVSGWIPPVDSPLHAPWTDSVTLNVQEMMAETQRRFPLRDGTGNLNLFPTPAGTQGLRYHLALPAHQCVQRTGESHDAAMGRCDAETRANADFIMRFYNGTLDSRRVGTNIDRLDIALLLVAGRESWGGQSCWGAQRSTAGWVTSNPMSGHTSTATHEIAHCLGQVKNYSPNSDGGPHARIWDLSLPSNMPLIDMRSHIALPTPVSLMNGAVANVHNTFLEAFEWNDLRRTFLSRSGLLASTQLPERPLLASRRFTPGILAQLQTPAAFGLTGTLHRNGSFSAKYSMSSSSTSPGMFNSDEKSDYAVIFYGKAGDVLARYGFQPVFETPDRQNDTTGVSLIYPLPNGTARAAVTENTRVLHQVTCDGVPPVVDRIEVAPNQQGDTTLRWKAWHPLKRDLRYAVQFSRDGKELPLTLALGISEQEFVYPKQFASGSNGGYFQIIASDGCNTATAISQPVHIAPRAPIAFIRKGRADAGRMWFLATAYDYTDGSLPDSSLRWFAGGREVGKGERIEVDSLTEKGPVTLVVTNAAGLQTTAATTLEP